MNPGETMGAEIWSAEWAMAWSVLRTARARIAADLTLRGKGHADRDLARRLRDALRRVRYLEIVATRSGIPA